MDVPRRAWRDPSPGYYIIHLEVVKMEKSKSKKQ